MCADGARGLQERHETRDPTGRRSDRIERHGPDVFVLVESKPDITLVVACAVFF